jgi:hypothetical protein
MRTFKEWFEIKEAMVKTSDAGSAIKQTLQFKIEDAEWIKLELEKKGWITDKGVKDSFDLSAAFYHPKIKKPAFFFLRSFAIIENNAEYDSKKGGDQMKINAVLFVFSGKTGLGGFSGFSDSKNARDVLKIQGNLKLSERNDDLKFPGGILDGPSLKTPLELAWWVNKVIMRTDIDGFDDNEDDDEPKDPVLEPTGKFATV